MTEDLEVWLPATTAELVERFSGAPFRRWIAGGVALELYLGRSWRDHDDADVGICRNDAGDVYEWLAGLHLYVAAGGRLCSWDGRPLSLDANENNVWVKDDALGPWRFDMGVDEGDVETWVYRRDHTIGRPWTEAVLTTPGGIPFLAPEVQLLFKSKGIRAKDQIDANVVLPSMEEHRRQWLDEHLPIGHPWKGWTATT
jgi:hypothetical protein